MDDNCRSSHSRGHSAGVRESTAVRACRMIVPAVDGPHHPCFGHPVQTCLFTHASRTVP